MISNWFEDRTARHQVWCKKWNSRNAGERRKIQRIDDHHKKTFAPLARKKFHSRGYDLYFSFRDFLLARLDLPREEFIAEAWELLYHSAMDERPLRGGGHMSPHDLFVESFLSEYKLSGEDARKRASNGYLSWLSNSIFGVIGERDVLVELRGLFGEERVRAASNSDESADVDLYIDDLPVSVKTGGAFAERTFRKYREEYKKDRPVLYVNTGFQFARPVGSEFPVFRGEGLLVRVVEDLVRESAGLRARVPEPWDYEDEFDEDDY